MLKCNIKDKAFSLKLSQVMGDIGVTEKIILKRRRSFMLMEALDTLTHNVKGMNVATYNLGSQSEGSTTIDLDPDIDTLFVYNILNIVRDWNEADQPGTQKVLMVQDETTAPGHCLLQFELPKLNFSYPIIDQTSFMKDGKGRFLLKNTCFDDILKDVYTEKNGPAHTFERDNIHNDEDNVSAWNCKYWPKEAQQWIVNTCLGRWPSEDLMKECEATGCTIVPVCSKGSRYEELEWRISTCLAERHLMFSLNVTQMRCYVLMKMIIKTYLQPTFPDVKISSYVCKTILFHCIQNSKSNEWKENNLLWCLRNCLVNLETSIINTRCTHFFIPGNNLLVEKISTSRKEELATYIHSMIQSIANLPWGISLDCLNVRLFAKMFPEYKQGFIYNFQSAQQVSILISGRLLNHIAVQLDIRHKFHLKSIYLCDFPMQYAQITLKDLASYSTSSERKTACKLIEPFFCSTLASITASNNIKTMNCISDEARDLFAKGFDSDVSSGKLRSASALYCVGEIETTCLLLKHIERNYDYFSIDDICSCNEHKGSAGIMMGFSEKSDTGNEELIKDITSFCVKFLPCEINCVPHELRYEMYRLTGEDKPYRNKNKDFWMNWMAVDSLPFLYFLLYKTYGRLQMAEEQKIALFSLEIIVQKAEDLGHRETALNLLGQCMEQENRINDALDMYMHSLKVRRRNNAAKIHICRLLFAIYSKKQRWLGVHKLFL